MPSTAPRTIPHLKPRRSTSSSLQRRLLSLYAQKRRLSPTLSRPFPLLLFTLILTLLLSSLFTPPQAPLARGLRAVAAALFLLAERVDAPQPTRAVTVVPQFPPVSVPVAVPDSLAPANVPPSLLPTADTSVRPVQQKPPAERQEDGLQDMNYVTPRAMPPNHETLAPPKECPEWRHLARNTSQVVPYRRHFTSLDVTDWFLYISIFDEAFHKTAISRHRRPRYLDVAANHARRWSNTWFFDRCMGWDGVCVEANPRYFAELQAARHCHVVQNCVSDVERVVRFSMTDAYGGVVRGEGQRFGVDGRMHATLDKFKREFHGIQELTCTTLAREMRRLEMMRFDFMSLDVEGHELPVLQGIDWRSTRISVIVTENRTPVVQQLLEKEGFTLFAGVLKDYIYIHKDCGLTIRDEFLKLIARFDRKNYRFRPE